MPLSVVKNKRNESEVEFLLVARQLEVYTIQKCVSFPKRYTFYMSQPIAVCAVKIFECVKCGNSVYPTNKEEAQMRIDYFLEAYAELENLISQIEMANELFGIEAKKMQYWMEIVDKEIRLIKGVISKDRERYKNLP